MIFEMRTYLMKPGSIPKVEELFGAALPARTKLSRLAGFWHTEVGTLNQIIHIWPYKDMAERDHIRAEAVKTGVWPPKISEHILEMESKILHPAPFSPAFEPAEHGSLFARDVTLEQVDKKKRSLVAWYKVGCASGLLELAS